MRHTRHITVRFASLPRGPWQLLGFDPRGDAVQVRLASDDVLTGNVPFDAGSDDSDVACCIADDSGPKCEDRTADECAAQGGTVNAAASCLPNPCVAPLDRGPWYAIEIVLGDLGTFAGLRTDAKTRVLDAAGEPISGLHAVGNDAASVMGGAYPGGGITLGPALTFGYIAGTFIAGPSSA